MTIPAGLWPEISALLDDALNLEPGARAAWLSRLDDDRPGPAPHVRRLLEAHGRPAAADPLRSPPTGLMSEALHNRRPASTRAAGDMIGPYRLLAPLGQGGMASVWLADQTANVRRRVALKIPHLGLEAAPAARERFERERDLLAGLEHEHIARLYDAGVTADGVSYLAMEWIDGQPVTAYCDARRLSVDARLALFRQVLQAVGHAHASLVIHRDIKASNILVAPSGQVKLLDFGIANLMQEQLGDAPARDALTPETASPEQLAGGRIGTASDVYSLGVVLYELLTGQPPYVLNRGSPNLRDDLLATSVTPPSRVAFSDGAVAARSASMASLRRRLRGELDAIVARAMAKVVEDRYPSVDALGDDLAREAVGEPVRAVEGGALYRLRRLVVRQRWPLAAAAALVVVLAGAAAGIARQAQEARLQAVRADHAKNFVLSIFESADTDAGANRNTTALELLQQAPARIDREFAGDAAASVQLLTSVATGLMALGDDAGAGPVVERAVKLAEHTFGAGDPRTCAALAVYGQWLVQNGRSDAADQVLARAVAGLRQSPDAASLLAALESTVSLRYLQARYPEALAVAREAVAIAESRLPTERHAARSWAYQTLAGALRSVGADGRIDMLRKSLAEVEAGSGGVATVPVLRIRTMLAEASAEAGEADASISAVQAVLADLRRLLGPAHPLITETMSSLAIIQFAAGDPDAAATTQRELLAIDAASGRGPGAANYGEDWMSLGQYLLAAHREAESVTADDSALAYVKQASGAPNEVYVAAIRAGRAVALARQSLWTLAERDTEGLRPELQSNGSVAFWLGSCLAEVRSLQGRHADAIVLMTGARDALGPEASLGQQIDGLVEDGQVRLAAGRADEALVSLQRAIALLRTRHRQGSKQLADALMAASRAHFQLGDRALARTEADETHALWARLDPHNPAAAQADAWRERIEASVGHGASDKLR